MKILLTGTIHTGKTTVLDLLKGLSLPNVSVINEVAREMLSANPALEQSPAFQDILFTEQVRRERNAEKTSPVVICDRGSLDIISHSKLFGHAVQPEWVEWLKTYSQVLLFDKSEIPFNGENRAFNDHPRDWIQFRNSLEGMIEDSISEYRVPYLVLRGNPEQRLHRLLSETTRVSGNLEGITTGKEKL